MIEKLLTLLYASEEDTIRQAAELLHALSERAVWEAFWSELNLRRVTGGWRDVALLALAASSPPDLIPDRRLRITHRVLDATWCHAGAAHITRARVSEAVRPGLLSVLPAMPRLHNLTLDDCNRLVSLDGLGRFAALRTLTVRRCTHLATLDGIGACTQLSTIRLRELYRLDTLDVLATLPVLSQLSMDAVGRYRAALRLQSRSLRSLYARNIPRIGLTVDAPLTHLDTSAQEIAPLLACPTLRDLSLSGSTEVPAEVHGDFTQLRRLRVGVGLKDTAPLTRLAQLRSLDLRDCTHIRRLPDLSGLRKLRRLVLPTRLTAQGLSELSLPPTLRHLSAQTDHLTSLYGLRRLPNLETLETTDKIRWHAPEEAPPALRPVEAPALPALDLWLSAHTPPPTAEAIKTAAAACVLHGGPSLAKARSLRWLELDGYTRLPDWLKGLPVLEELSLRGNHITLSSVLASLKALKRLTVSLARVSLDSGQGGVYLPSGLEALSLEGIRWPVELTPLLRGCAPKRLSVSASGSILRRMSLPSKSNLSVHIETTSHIVGARSLLLEATEVTLLATVVGFRLSWISRAPWLHRLVLRGEQRVIRLPMDHMLQTLDLRETLVSPASRRIWARGELPAGGVIR